MDLRHPMRSIVPSLDADVLEVLAGTTDGLGLSHIARLAPRGTRQGISHVIRRLVDHGVVLAGPSTQGNTYRLNRDHVLVPAVLAIVDSRTEVIARLADLVAAIEPEPVHVSIFGSFARGEAGPESDIDVLMICAKESDLRSIDGVIDGLNLEIDQLTGNRGAVLALTIAELHRLVRANEPIIDAWRADSVLLLGREFDRLSGAGGTTRNPRSSRTTRR